MRKILNRATVIALLYEHFKITNFLCTYGKLPIRTSFKRFAMFAQWFVVKTGCVTKDPFNAQVVFAMRYFTFVLKRYLFLLRCI